MMIHCQKCGIAAEAGDGLRILPFLAIEPDSVWDWLALCRPCFEGETADRARHRRCHTYGYALAAPSWDEAPELTTWHRAMLGEK